MVMPAKVKIFTVILGILFISMGVIISTSFDIPEVIPVGMGIIGLFLMILPYTHVEKKQQ